MAMSQAWHCAALSRSASMPALSDLLGDEREAQSPDEMIFNMQAWAAATQVSPMNDRGEH